MNLQCGNMLLQRLKNPPKKVRHQYIPPLHVITHQTISMYSQSAKTSNQGPREGRRGTIAAQSNAHTSYTRFRAPLMYFGQCKNFPACMACHKNQPVPRMLDDLH